MFHLQFVTCGDDCYEEELCVCIPFFRLRTVVCFPLGPVLSAISGHVEGSGRRQKLVTSGRAVPLVLATPDKGFSSERNKKS